jgi:hypothetical protein
MAESLGRVGDEAAIVVWQFTNEKQVGTISARGSRAVDAEIVSRAASRRGREREERKVPAALVVFHLKLQPHARLSLDRNYFRS